MQEAVADDDIAHFDRVSSLVRKGESIVPAADVAVGDVYPLASHEMKAVFIEDVAAVHLDAGDQDVVRADKSGVPSMGRFSTVDAQELQVPDGGAVHPVNSQMKTGVMRRIRFIGLENAAGDLDVVLAAAGLILVPQSRVADASASKAPQKDRIRIHLQMNVAGNLN